MKNPLPFVVVSIKLAVLGTLTYLICTEQLLDDRRRSFFFLLYSASFLLYAISSLSDPGYLNSCPLEYLPNDERGAFKATLSERTGEQYNRKDVPRDFSITHDEITSSDSLSSETVSTNGEMDSLTIIHHRNRNTAITERKICKEQKDATTMRYVYRNHSDPTHEEHLLSANQTKYACQENFREGVKFQEKFYPQGGRRVHPTLRILLSHNLRFIGPLGMRTRENENCPSKYKPLLITQLHNVGWHNRENHEEENYMKGTMGDSLKQIPITCSVHAKMKPSSIFRVRGGEMYQYGTPLSYCYVCGVVQILRSKHCNACNRCVRTFDHHCPWINNCVAENNRASYLVYLLLEAITVFYALKLLSHVILRMFFGENGCFFAWLVVLFLVLFFLFTMIFCLAIYHSYLCLINETTRENALRVRSTTEITPPRRKPAGTFFLGYRQNVLIYFSNLPAKWICPQVIRHYMSGWLYRTKGVTWGTHGEILWKPIHSLCADPKSFPSQAIFLSILEYTTSCVRRQFSPMTFSIE